MSNIHDDSAQGDHQPTQTREEFNSKTYPEDVSHVGRALIINNDDFQGDGLNARPTKRENSGKDLAEVQKLLLSLGFKSKDIATRLNLTKQEMIAEIENKAKLDYTNYGCFLCVVMSFGEPGIIICPGKNGKDERCELKQIQAPFTGDKCRSLAVKPKIYFIMGNNNYEEIHASEGGEGSRPQVKLETRKIPRECHFVTQYSSDHDHGQWKLGKMSPYISSVVEAFNTHVLKGSEDMDILKLMTRINKLMVYKHEAETPLVTSLLTKRYHFRPKPTETIPRPQ
ncbi:caspase-7-like [Ylistrum balloti]|uniref:caspase-7-like n=1 Tax=Ylistrum balloti TaxID=509963 RepID=UPI002905D65D|nr:caspase-7-like [Ylistrum balloti]